MSSCSLKVKMKTIILSLFLCCSKTFSTDISCDESSSTDSVCWFRNLNLPRNEVNYKIYQPKITEAVIRESKIAVITSEFCKTFPLITYFSAAYQSVRVVSEDAFTSCENVERINLECNFIKILPENLFASNYKLKMLQLSINKIIGISQNQFRNNSKLRDLRLNNNHLSEFPAESVKNTRLEILFLYSNDIFDLDDVDELVKLPKLKDMALNDNLFPCKRLRQIVDRFKEKGINSLPWIIDYIDRGHKMGYVDGLSCIDDEEENSKTENSVE